MYSQLSLSTSPWVVLDTSCLLAHCSIQLQSVSLEIDIVKIYQSVLIVYNLFIKVNDNKTTPRNTYRSPTYLASITLITASPQDAPVSLKFPSTWSSPTPQCRLKIRVFVCPPFTNSKHILVRQHKVFCMLNLQIRCLSCFAGT